MTRQEALDEIHRLSKLIYDLDRDERWKANEKEFYWHIDDNDVDKFADSEGILSDKRYRAGNYFKTEGLANRVGGIWKIIGIAASMTDVPIDRWEEFGAYSYMVIDLKEQKVRGHWGNSFHIPVPFKTPEAAQKCVDFIGEEEILECFGAK